MTTFVQVHLLVFLPPSNVNRDDTGRPKTAMIGNETRLRISSQSWKRAMRGSDIFTRLLAGKLGTRTQRFGTEVAEALVADGVEPDKATATAREVIALFGKPKPPNDRDPLYTEQLAFLSPEEKSAAIDLARRRAAGEIDAIEAKKVAPSILKGADTAADIAMFGRMFADNPDFNREAAVQVAHAITTHRVAVEDDYYTAVDDLKKPAEDAGAGFVGEAGFGSGVFYLYVCVDTDLLIRNLAGDVDLARDAVEALVTAAATVVPSGKQASFASRAFASYVLAEKGEDQPRSLASAFAKGVRGDGSVLGLSVERLTETRARFARAYGLDIPTVEMDVEAGRGSLADIVAFVRGFGAEMPAVTVFRLAAPIASFGDLAVGERRSTHLRPGHAAVTGLLAGALGIGREDPGHEELALAFHLAVRTDRLGTPLADYHTAQMPPARRGRSYATRREELAGRSADLNTVVSRRDYRAGVDFAVLLWPVSAEGDKARCWAEALNRPRFAPFAGRRSCPLGAPMQAMAIEAETVLAALRLYDDTSAHAEAFPALARAAAATLAIDEELRPVSGLVNGFRAEIRRDRLIDRRRWQFGLRTELVATLGTSEQNP